MTGKEIIEYLQDAIKNIDNAIQNNTRFSTIQDLEQRKVNFQKIIEYVELHEGFPKDEI